MCEVSSSVDGPRHMPPAGGWTDVGIGYLGRSGRRVWTRRRQLEADLDHSVAQLPCINGPTACSYLTEGGAQLPLPKAGTRASPALLEALLRTDRFGVEAQVLGEAWTRLSAGTGSGSCSRGGRW